MTSKQKIELATLVVRAEDVLATDIDGEVVMMSIRHGTYSGLDAVGSEIWELMDRPRTVSEIVVEPWDAAEAPAVRLYLRGSAFGALLHQRGLAPFHGSAVALGGGAVILVGPSGAGKTDCGFCKDWPTRPVARRIGTGGHQRSGGSLPSPLRRHARPPL